MIPLYQHILITIQTLPDPVNTLCAVSDLVGSVFSYRTPSLAVEAFSEFWMTSCANVPAPAGGWPENISRTLRAVGLLPKNYLPKSGSLSPAFSVTVSPRTPISSSTSPSVLKRKRIPSPHRPHKVFGKFPTIPTSPVSPTARHQRRLPTSALTPRTPLSDLQIREMPLYKRRRLNSDGKENSGISQRPLVSVAERIADLLKPNGSLLRKRKLETREDDEDSPANNSISTPSKKMKERMKPKRKKSISATTKTLNSPNLTTNSEEDRRCIEEALNSPTPTLPTMDVVDHCIARTKVVYGRPPIDVGGQGPVHDAAQFKKIDFNEIRNTVRRSCSTSDELWNAIERRKRRRSDIDESCLTKLACPSKGYILRRTASMPKRLGCPDSDSTVVEWPIATKTKRQFKPMILDAEADMTGSDDALPASDDTVFSSSSSSSSDDEDSPTKGALNRYFERHGLESKIRPHLLL